MKNGMNKIETMEAESVSKTVCLTPLTAYRNEERNGVTETIWYLALPNYDVYSVRKGNTAKLDITVKEGKRIYEKLYIKGSKAQIDGFTVISDGFVFPN